MLTLKNSLEKIKINNYVDYSNWNTKLSDVVERLTTLTIDELNIGQFNCWTFIKNNETVEWFSYRDNYNNIIINIEDIF